MNSFSSFQSQLFRGGVNINSFSYVNKSSYGITLDPSGTDYIGLVDGNSNPVTNAYKINTDIDVSNTFLEVELSHQPIKASDFLPNNTTDTTIYMKYKHNSALTSGTVFSHLFSDLVYSIKLTGTTVDSVHTIDPGQSFDAHYLVGGADTITYSISGVLDSVSLPETGHLLTTYEKKTVTLGSDASSGIIEFHVNDILTNTQVYIPFRYELTRISIFQSDYKLQIDGQAVPVSIEQSPGIHYFDFDNDFLDTLTDFSFNFYQDSGYSNLYTNGVDVSDNYVRIVTGINTPKLYFKATTTSGLETATGSFVNLRSYDYVYTVKVVTNDVGKDVYAIDVNGDGVFYNQPDISFNGGFKYLFDVSDLTNDPYTLTFGTEVDGTGDEDSISRSDGKVLLDLTAYAGSETYRYFEDTSAGMGYVEATTTNSTTVYVNDVLNSNRKYTSDKWGLTDSTFDGLGWAADKDALGEDYVEIDITSPIYVTGIGIKGENEQERTTQQYVTQYKVSYSVDSSTFTWVDNQYLFDGNTSFPTTEVINNFSIPVYSRYIRIFPLDYSVYPTFRVRLYVQDEYIGLSSYVVTLSGDPLVFDLSDILQAEIEFVAGTSYIFDQSDPDNSGNQIVFGRTPDDPIRFIEGVTIMGTPGQPGAYTQLDLSAGFVGPLFYYHDTIQYRGYGPMVLSVDEPSRAYGDVVTFTITNRTGIAEPYTITGVDSEDISGADLTGSIGYGQRVDLSYTITGSDKTMVFLIGDVSASVSIVKLISYPVIHFTLDNTLTSIGTNTSATLTNTSYSYVTSSRKGTHCMYSSTGGTLKIQDSTSVITTTEGYTFTFWMKHQSLASSGDSTYVDFSTTTNYYGLILWKGGSHDNKLNIGGIDVECLSMNSGWHHYALTYEKMSYETSTGHYELLTIYYDGVQVGQGHITSNGFILSSSTAAYPTIKCITYGHNTQNTAHNKLIGYLDDLRVYDKALTLSDINEIISS